MSSLPRKLEDTGLSFAFITWQNFEMVYYRLFSSRCFYPSCKFVCLLQYSRWQLQDVFSDHFFCALFTEKKKSAVLFFSITQFALKQEESSGLHLQNGISFNFTKATIFAPSSSRWICLAVHCTVANIVQSISCADFVLDDLGLFFDQTTTGHFVS